ncbi:MAG TPA: ABC transporter permease [Candidatus Sulfopaludibacter sp.]|nr:ABC transporter permease [Candidatus Sulfopaludibacter sp.]
MGTLRQNLRYALRQLARNPGFTLTVTVTLALAIGANTAIFSIVNALLLKSLPYLHPERMGTIFMRVEGAEPFEGHHWIDGTQWELLRDNVPSLIAAVSSGGTSGVNLQAAEQVQYVHQGRISAHYLDVVGVRPMLGRNFLETEDLPHGPPAVILSYGLWRNIFAADPSLVGRTIHLKGQPYTVIGVLPQGAATPINADLYTALQPSRTGEGGGTNYEVITRLKDGATWQQADAELNRAWAERIAAYARRHPGSRAVYYSVPLQKGATVELRPKALTLMVAAGFILLIACANLAGLAVVRMVRRTTDVATRLALGASHWQVQKQFWIESLLLGIAGGAVGIGVGFAALRGLLSLLPKDYLPVASVPLDLRVLAFTLVVSVMTAVLFGVLPALTVRRVDLRSSIASRGVAGGERLRLRQVLIAGEVALTVVLLAGSGLLIRTLIHLQTLPPGFNPKGVMAAKASLDDARYHDPAKFAQLLTTSVAAMKQIPGVSDAAMGLSLPFERVLNNNLQLQSGPYAGKNIGTDEVYITPGYFATLEIPLLSGRDFAASDGQDTQSVAIVNRTFAQKFFPGENPVGRTLYSGTVIVGVVADTQLSSGLNPTAPLQSEETMYIPATQMGPQTLAMVHVWFQPSWIVRTAAPVEGLTAQMQRALASADPGLPFSGFYSMNDLQAETLATQRIEVALLSAMAGLALLLSAVGIFALVANMVAQRTREIGIRMALGSTVRQAMAHIGGSGLRASGAGLVLGVALCAVTLRVMRSVLYGVGVYDATTLVAVVMTLAVITLAATIGPTLRIARIDPARTLREE